jgi:5-methylthioribose kinase
MEEETEKGLPRVLIANGKKIVQFFQESFDEAWNKPNSIQIYPEQENCEHIIEAMVP